MKFKKPIAFLDLETTGVDILKDRIVQIAVIKINVDGTTDEKQMLINPSISIPLGASEVHGITDEMVVDSPKFSQIAVSLNLFLDGCDLGGYNSNYFDVPLLIEEFKRCGIDFSLENRNFVDVFNIERQLNKRNLSSVYKRYTGKDLDGAHDAMIDVRATIEILEKQIEINNLEIDSEKLDLLSQGDVKRVDLAGKLCEIDGEICWAFGKHYQKPIKNDISYVNWFLTQQVPSETEKIIRKTLSK